jgi:hypothetical protein
MKFVKQLNDPGEGLGIKKVSLISRTVATHEVG